MISSFNTFGGDPGTVLQGREQNLGEQQQQQQHNDTTSSSPSVFARKPQTVISTSSLETTGYDSVDYGQGFGFDSNSTSTALNHPSTNAVIPSSTEADESSGNRSNSQISAAASGRIMVGTPDQCSTSSNSNIHFGDTSNCILEQQTQIQPSSIPLAAQSPPRTGSMQISPSTGVVVASSTNTANANTVPEFLYQLTKMLTDNNRDIIEWSNAKIEVHSPRKLETHVLNRYFRHSKFASFQRQLNYFGFRKLAGKGKMAPCSYVNDATTDELGSLLLIKRKQGNEPKSKAGGKKRDRNGKQDNSVRNTIQSDSANSSDAMNLNPVLAGILYRSSSDSCIMTTNTSMLEPSQKAIARVAVGKGVRHGFVPQQRNQNKLLKTIDSSPPALTSAVASNSNNLQAATTQSTSPSPVQASLNALTQNFNESLQGAKDFADLYAAPQPPLSSMQRTGPVGYVPGSLRRDDSLVDLAMIPGVAGNSVGDTTDSNAATSTGFSFVDFPFEPNFFFNEDNNT